MRRLEKKQKVGVIDFTLQTYHAPMGMLLCAALAAIAALSARIVGRVTSDPATSPMLKNKDRLLGKETLNGITPTLSIDAELLKILSVTNVSDTRKALNIEQKERNTIKNILRPVLAPLKENDRALESLVKCFSKPPKEKQDLLGALWSSDVLNEALINANLRKLFCLTPRKPL